MNNTETYEAVTRYAITPVGDVLVETTELLIRCKDCRFYGSKVDGFSQCANFGVLMISDGFCSMGEL